MTTTEERIESLQRALDEIEVIEAIYGCPEQDDVATSSFSIVSVAEHQKAKDLLTIRSSSGDASSGANISQLEIELRIPIINNDNDVEAVCNATLRWCLPPGYPLIPAVVSIISLTALRRGSREELSNEVNRHAKELAGQEAILQLVEFLKEKLAEHLARDRIINKTVECDDTTISDEAQSSHSTKWGRRWIWVHHITDTDRCKSIVQEAKELGLGGYLKPGYPGVVVVEGPSVRCDEFVSFIKGNKSRPGGFGRNWGHHVRGHIDFDTCITEDGNDEEDTSGGHAKKKQQRPQLTTEFKELEEDLATLGKMCRECGLEDEFKEYIMQHKR